MLGRLRSRLSYANVVASLALFVALGGTGYAAVTITGKDVKNNSLTGKDIKNSSLGGADVKNGSLLSKDFKAGQLPAGAPGAVGPQGAVGGKGDTGDPGTKGDRGDIGEAGTARAFAFVGSGGAVDETRSKGVSDANVSATSNVYCFKGLGFTPKNIMVTQLESYANAMVEMGDPGSLCHFRVVLSTPNGFMVLIN